MTTEQLNIPDFLLSTPPRHASEEEVDAMMDAVMQAAGVESAPAPNVDTADNDSDAATVENTTSDNGPSHSNGDSDEPEADVTVAEAVLAEKADSVGLSTEPTAKDDVLEPAPGSTSANEAEATATESAPDPDAADGAPTTPPPSLAGDLATLNELERHLYAHRYVMAELEAFGETIDPIKATADRAEAMAILTEEDHALLSDPKAGETLERLAQREEEVDPLVLRQVQVLIRDRAGLVSLSAADQAELIRVQAQAYDAWRDAKAANDWAAFAPHLDRLVALRRKAAKAKRPDLEPYDTMLDDHEPGTNRAFYNSFFASVKQAVVPLLSSISMSPRRLSRTCVEGHFDEARQWLLARDIARLEGIDDDAHYLTSTEHPFSESMTSNYVVTAAHVVPDNILSNVYTMLHEIGHNLYEQGVDPKLNRTSLKGGTSMGMHEAQSRFFENYIGRDRAFIGPLLQLMRKHFPGQLGRVTPNQLYQAVNRVEPSLVRTEADELTYPLHIIIRYEIEQDLVSGKVTAVDVPALWAERYSRYLGIVVPNDTQGALQDVHWAQGNFGYFPTYALGNAYGAQLRAKMLEEGMDWQGLLAAGDLQPIRVWLRSRVWQYGRSRDAAQIIEAACGEKFTPRHYANYLHEKYSALYGLR